MINWFLKSLENKKHYKILYFDSYLIKTGLWNKVCYGLKLYFHPAAQQKFWNKSTMGASLVNLLVIQNWEEWPQRDVHPFRKTSRSRDVGSQGHNEGQQSKCRVLHLRTNNAWHQARLGTDLLKAAPRRRTLECQWTRSWP